LVAVGLPRSAGTPAVWLGVWKAGGAFLPLDPEYPSERIGLMLRDAGASLLVTQSSLLPKFTAAMDTPTSAPAALRKIVCLDTSRACVAHNDTRNLELKPAANTLAYVIYTSGSQGTPKGVMITQANVAHYVQAMSRAIGITAQDRYLHTASFSFSSSMRQFALPLSCGGAISIASMEEIRNPRSLFEAVRLQRVSVLDLVPSFSAQCLRVLMSLDSSARATLLDNHVRLMLSASEPLPSALIEDWRRLVRPGTTFVNMFGQTETTGIVTTHRIPNDGDASAIVPVGRPIADTQAYVLDKSRCQVPVGSCGELYVGGAGVGRGYVNQRDLTANKFVPNPFSGDRDERLYRTGDTVRYRTDGVIEFVGRSDEQVKIRGFRIEPGEIEARLARHPCVRQAVVLAREDGGGEQRLVAYVTPDEPAQPPNPESLRKHLLAALPDYMVPAAFVVLDALPLTPNGKLDRKALPAPDARALIQHVYEAPQGEVEQALAEIWQELLRIERIGRHDNFFELGGHSLLAVRLMLFVRKRFGRVLALATLFEAGTIMKLATILRGEAQETPWSPLVAIRPQGTRAPLFCIHPSGGNVLGYMEFASHLDPDMPVYGLQAYGVVEGQEPHTSIAEMARVYVGLIRSVQPHGPYFLGGESIGGLIAYEIACQIAASGDEVALVFLGDIWSCNVAQFKRWRYALSSLTYLRSVSWQQWRELLRRKILRQTESRPYVQRYTFADELHRRNSLAHDQAALDFSPSPFPGKVTLFRAREFRHRTGRMQHYFGGPEMCWPALAAGGVELHWMPDTHREMMHGTNAYGFARLLQDCIDRAQRHPACSTLLRDTRLRDSGNL
jgi:amino acid adenylation domain-containing protein